MKTKTTPSGQEHAWKTPSMASLDQSASPSPLTELFSTESFQLGWDNNLAFHVANHVIHLRQYRGETQMEIAKAMGTSQAKIARIEGGDANITLETIERLVAALRGRLRFAIEPSEIHFPQMPVWWECALSGLTASTVWTLNAVAADSLDNPQKAAAMFSCHSPAQTVTKLASIHDQDLEADAV
jgi:transcriptional regulator with XRE-family HTH domain